MTARLEAIVNDAAGATGFSGVVRVAVDRERVFEAAYGLADRANRVANGVDTRFGIASGAKVLTALGVGALIDDGVLTLDTRLTDVVRHALPNVSADVTLRHLLTHTSGVYDFYDEELIDDFDQFELAVPPAKLQTLDDYLPLMVAGPAKFAPGDRFAYSNGGYVLLGLAIEAASGAPYHTFVTERVLRRAGMVDSGFFRFDQLPARVAHGYIDDDTAPDGWRTNNYQLPIVPGPDGGATSTALDIERLWLALLDGAILSPALTETFLQRTARYKPHAFYSHGVWIHDDGRTPARFYLEGCDAGVSFKSTCHRSGTIATVLSNTSDGAWAISDAVEAELFA